MQKNLQDVFIASPSESAQMEPQAQEQSTEPQLEFVAHSSDKELSVFLTERIKPSQS